MAMNLSIPIVDGRPTLTELVLSLDLASATWLVSGVDAAWGAAAEPLIQVSEAGQPIEGRRLIEALSRSPQVLEGEFDAYDRQGRRILRIIAIEDSGWDLESEDGDLLSRIARGFGSS